MSGGGGREDYINGCSVGENGAFIFGYLKLDINASIYGQTKKRCGS